MSVWRHFLDGSVRPHLVDRNCVGGRARAQTPMAQGFGRLPKTSVIVTPIPPAEELTTRDRYWPGTVDGKRAAEFQINAAEWIGLRRGDLGAVVFHETISGPHLEMTLSLERQNAHLLTKDSRTRSLSRGMGRLCGTARRRDGLYGSDIDRLGMWQGPRLPGCTARRRLGAARIQVVAPSSQIQHDELPNPCKANAANSAAGRSAWSAIVAMMPRSFGTACTRPGPLDDGATLDYLARSGYFND